MATDYTYEYFNVTFPMQWVAHVEINRPEKMNAFKEMYVWLFHVHLLLFSIFIFGSIVTFLSIQV